MATASIGKEWFMRALVELAQKKREPASDSREPVRWQIEGDSVRWAAIDAMNDEELAKCFTTSAWSSWQLHALYPLQTKQRRAKGNREV
jgi:hypothetical protein